MLATHRKETNMERPTSSYLLIICFALMAPGYALAYIGPGASNSALLTTIVLLGVVFLAVVALAWYPIKKLVERKREKKS